MPRRTASQRRPPLLSYPALPSLFFCAVVALAGCGEEKVGKKEPSVDEPRRARPAAPVRRSPAENRKLQKTPAATSEKAAGQLGAVQGRVVVRTHRMDPAHPAREKEALYGGARLFTEEKGRAVVAFRHLGALVIQPESRLLVPPYGGFGAVLVRGSVTVEGEPGTGAENAAYLHTPAVALWVREGAKAAVSVEPGGDTRVEVRQGTVELVDLQGHGRELGPDDDLTVAVDPRPTVRASQIARRLALDVERLQELMELNKRAGAERAALKPGKEEADEKLAELNRRFVEQARELVDLKKKGHLQMFRIFALLDIARSADPENDEAQDAARAVEKRLTALGEELPPLFDRPGVASP